MAEVLGWVGVILGLVLISAYIVVGSTYMWIRLLRFLILRRMDVIIKKSMGDD
jgi:hypothetical protein